MGIISVMVASTGRVDHAGQTTVARVGERQAIAKAVCNRIKPIVFDRITQGIDITERQRSAITVGPRDEPSLDIVVVNRVLARCVTPTDHVTHSILNVFNGRPGM